MSEHSIGIRELKANLSDYLEKVRAGANLMVTEHHTPIASLEPEEDENLALKERVLQLRDAGLLSWNGEKLSLDPVLPLKLREDVLASDLILEDRE